jgi:hypothetical protein
VDQIYSVALECFVSSSTISTSLTVHLSGNTLLKDVEILYKASVSKNTLKFPPCHIGDSGFYTTELSNDGNYPFQFSMEHDQDSSEVAFTCKPSKGVLAPNTKVILAFQFHPKETKQYSSSFQCFVNKKPLVSFQLSGAGEIPNVDVDPSDAIYFKPTSVGVISKRAITLTNTSRLPVEFELDLPEKYQDVLTIEPNSGQLSGGESINVIASFVPHKVRNYSIPLTTKYHGAVSEGIF